MTRKKPSRYLIRVYTPGVEGVVMIEDGEASVAPVLNHIFGGMSEHQIIALCKKKGWNMVEYRAKASK